MLWNGCSSFDSCKVVELLSCGPPLLFRAWAELVKNKICPPNHRNQWVALQQKSWMHLGRCQPKNVCFGMVAIPLALANLFLRSHGMLEGQAAALSAWTESIKNEINPPHDGDHCCHCPSPDQQPTTNKQQQVASSGSEKCRQWI